MPDMYDKLGEMLNEALESGKIPQDNKHESEEESVVEPVETTDSSSDFIKNTQKSTENNKKSAKKNSKTAFATGEVIKLHKYTYNMQFPSHIQKALGTLDIAYPFTAKDIKKQYHKLLKENHPDTQNTIHTSQDVENSRQKTIDDITEAYKILCQYFGIK
ncbi:J domain-containing protein [Treponema bryantii]|uniref:J domain-containing protein n=1 Tax=Treponema bryantii TaxID=163 RepID=UPI0003B67840|nr:J domain-containing protein [Treponema bryantii]